jgi:hypothetical protein
MRPESRSSAASPREPGGTPDRRVLVPSVSVGGSVLSESEWRERAAKVETEANHELDRLVGLLDLDGVQQNEICGHGWWFGFSRRIFPVNGS